MARDHDHVAYAAAVKLSTSGDEIWLARGAVLMRPSGQVIEVLAPITKSC